MWLAEGMDLPSNLLHLKPLFWRYFLFSACPHHSLPSHPASPFLSPIVPK